MVVFVDPNWHDLHCHALRELVVEPRLVEARLQVLGWINGFVGPTVGEVLGSNGFCKWVIFQLQVLINGIFLGVITY